MPICVLMSPVICITFIRVTKLVGMAMPMMIKK